MKTAVQINPGNHPNFKHFVFTLNPENHWYEMIKGKKGSTKVPAKLGVNVTRRRKLFKSGVYIHSRLIKGRWQFFTVLIPAGFDNWYFGDFYEIRQGIKKNSFILFHFSQDQTRFEMFFFNHLKVYPDHREKFIYEFINSLKN